jgi:hypothetical protein
MGKDFERGSFAAPPEITSKNAPKMHTKTALFGVDSGTKIDAENEPESARENAPEGGRKPHVFEQRKDVGIDAD